MYIPMLLGTSNKNIVCVSNVSLKWQTIWHWYVITDPSNLEKWKWMRKKLTPTIHFSFHVKAKTFFIWTPYGACGLHKIVDKRVQNEIHYTFIIIADHWNKDNTLFTPLLKQYICPTITFIIKNYDSKIIIFLDVNGM